MLSVGSESKETLTNNPVKEASDGQQWLIAAQPCTLNVSLIDFIRRKIHILAMGRVAA